MKHLIPILLFAVTAIATPVTEQFLIIHIRSTMPYETRIAKIDYVNSLYGSNFLSFTQFSMDTNVLNHSKVSNTVDHAVWDNYIWWGSQVSEKLSKEALAGLEQVFGDDDFDFYCVDDYASFYSQNHFVPVTPGVRPLPPGDIYQ